jgi:hypothetical protein
MSYTTLFHGASRKHVAAKTPAKRPTNQILCVIDVFVILLVVSYKLVCKSLSLKPQEAQGLQDMEQR